MFKPIIGPFITTQRFVSRTRKNKTAPLSTELHPPILAKWNMILENDKDPWLGLSSVILTDFYYFIQIILDYKPWWHWYLWKSNKMLKANIFWWFHMICKNLPSVFHWVFSHGCKNIVVADEWILFHSHASLLSISA